MVVLLGNTDEAPAREDAYLDLFREQRVNGVLITPAGDDIPKLERLRTAGIPVVLVDHDAPGSGLASVAVDDVEGGYLAVAHLEGLVAQQQFAPAFGEVVDLLLILVIMVIGCDAPLNHMACEISQSQQTRSLWGLSVFIICPREHRPDNLAFVTNIRN